MGTAAWQQWRNTYFFIKQKPPCAISASLTITKRLCRHAEDLDLFLHLAVARPGRVDPPDDHNLLLPRLLSDEVAGVRVAGISQGRAGGPGVGRQVEEVGFSVVLGT